MEALQKIKPKRLLLPTKFKLFYAAYKNKSFNYLDIGCGSHSPTSTKTWFPNCTYDGIDKQNYNNSEEDFNVMNNFYSIDLTKDSLSEIPDNHYDIIMLSHVIEHLENGDAVVAQAVKKLKTGGKIYIEYPGASSLSLPNMRGTLNFSDDPTHVRIYDIKEISNLLLQNSCTIIKAGIRKDPVRRWLFPLIWLDAYLRNVPGGAFWDVCDFAEYVYAERK